MKILIPIAVATFALSLVIAYPMMSFAQFEQKGNQSSSGSETGNQSSIASQIEIPMNFTLKSKGGEKAKEGQENKTVNVDVMVQSEGGSPTKVPVTAEVPNNTKVQDMQLCLSVKEGKESCQALKDLMPKTESQSSSGSSEKSSSDSKNSNDNG